MNHSADQFITACLAGVPASGYRERTEQELRGHLISLAQSLERTGMSPEEAQIEAVKRMGDPAALSGHYAAEWLRREARTPGHWLSRCSLAVFCLLTALLGVLYCFNARNFGKALVGYYGLTALAVAAVMLPALCFRGAGKWTVIRWGCLALAAVQLPPVICWLMFYGTYEMSGVMIPGWAGLLLHLLAAVWSLFNLLLADRAARREYGPGAAWFHSQEEWLAVR